VLALSTVRFSNLAKKLMARVVVPFQEKYQVSVSKTMAKQVTV
jgi:hypothetical protein